MLSSQLQTPDHPWATVLSTVLVRAMDEYYLPPSCTDSDSKKS